ncbi:hypothetical protein EHS25_009365 [Saitozyma podzolica]|uniref:Uncharacterized protein n=1 Tax=Saitozyma podzolica TaxID=1890683 RepID=A0A427YLK6_9TREE|nr:hypothetical protein EHS25_009365 [Saitozyma podzolica]
MFKLNELFGVSGKVVVVTGGGSGIGKAIATGFYENGAKVYITGRRKEVLEGAAKEMKANSSDGGEVICIQGDVATKEGCTKIADQIKAKESVLHTLINCAGVSKGWRVDAHPEHPDEVEKQMLAVEDEDFNYTNGININGVYFMTAALLSLLRKAEDPNVIVIASIAGLANQRATGSMTYGASKAGAIHLGKLLAGRLTPMKIRVNTICPGIFPSEMTGAIGSYESTGMNTMSQRAGLRNSLGRAGKPEEIVGPVLMLSTRGGGYCDGAVLTVDGGRLMAAGINDGVRMPDETNTYDLLA